MDQIGAPAGPLTVAGVPAATGGVFAGVVGGASPAGGALIGGLYSSYPVPVLVGVVAALQAGALVLPAVSRRRH